MKCTVEQLLDVARQELGYVEKRSDYMLDDKYANAGNGNFTKYARDLNKAGYYNGNKNGFAWCDVFVDWCFWIATGKNKAQAQAQEYQTGELGAGCVYSAGYYKRAKRWVKTPQPGDQIFFLDSDGEECHTGLVEAFDGKTVTTIEGNRENCVKRYKYSANDTSIAGYGRPSYATEEKAAILGIDVSGDQGVIDWQNVKSAGVGAAFIKFGNVYQTEDVYTDSKFKRNVTECERVGLPYGVYVYTYAATLERFGQEIEKAFRIIESTCKSIAYPVYLDIEEQAVVKGGNANTLAMVKVFAETAKVHGFKAGVYSSTSWWNDYLNDRWYDTIDKWVADWRGSCEYKGTYSIWQYSDNGKIDGISTVVDLNKVYVKATTLTNREQVYTVQTGDTWDTIGRKFGISGIPLLQYNNYATANAELAKKTVNQKTVKIPAKWIPGDVDGDGKITAADARKALRAAAKLSKLTAAETMRADFDGNGKVTAGDARNILKKAGGLL